MTRGRKLTDLERLHRSVKGDDLTRDIVQLAKLNGWLVHHSRKAQYGQTGRWATHVMGHIGLPDLILVKPPSVLFIEVKREVDDELTPMQEQWAAALEQCPVEYHVVRPSRYDALCKRLIGSV